MTVEAFPGQTARLATASDWLARLQRDDLSTDDAQAFIDWLESSPKNAAAYDAVLSGWNAFEGSERRILNEIDTIEGRKRSAFGLDRRWLLGAGGLAAAAGIAMAVLPELAIGPQAQSYATAKGQRQSVTLSDGSKVDLNADSKISVTLARAERRVIMGPGEAIFDVASDAGRPFTIDAGGNAVSVVGTQFNVRNREDGFAVTVSRGAVQVRPRGAGRTYLLHPGQMLSLTGEGAVRLSAIEPAEALSWRVGRLIYRDAPLSRVVTDLNHQFTVPIRIDDRDLAATPVSGVLVVDDQSQVIERLSLMLHLTAVPSDQSVRLRRQ